MAKNKNPMDVQHRDIVCGKVSEIEARNSGYMVITVNSSKFYSVKSQQQLQVAILAMTNDLKLCRYYYPDNDIVRLTVKK